jgi:hypothetical protein
MSLIKDDIEAIVEACAKVVAAYDAKYAGVSNVYGLLTQSIRDLAPLLIEQYRTPSSDEEVAYVEDGLTNKQAWWAGYRAALGLPEGVSRQDALRFKWLCEDHEDKEARQACREILNRASVMSISAMRTAIDIAIRNTTQQPTDKEVK